MKFFYFLVIMFFLIPYLCLKVIGKIYERKLLKEEK